VGYCFEKSKGMREYYNQRPKKLERLCEKMPPLSGLKIPRVFLLTDVSPSGPLFVLSSELVFQEKSVPVCYITVKAFKKKFLIPCLLQAGNTEQTCLLQEL
jgi:hypothetical protein